jgi:hypothetical protein
MPVVGQLKLHNTGAFVARLGARWITPGGEEDSIDPGGMGDVDAGQTGSLDPGEGGCEPGSRVWPWIDVVWGDNLEGSVNEGLIYQPGDPHAALYHSHGTTLDDHLGFDGIDPPE